MDPGPVPPELQGLTQVEEMLISPVMPIMSVYRLPHGQLSYSGHVINLPQDVASFVSSLPRDPSQLDVVVVRKEGSAGPHKDFKVRRSRVLHALQWLIDNNPYFSSISLDHDVLAQLPENGELPGLSTVTVSDDGDSNDSTTQQGEASDSDQLSSSFVPLVHRKTTEREAVEQVVSEQPTPVVWPPQGENPLNEFHSEGYITKAFPTLFPTGAADFTAPRVRPVTIGYYLKHLMMYCDGRFAKHPRFRYFALNSEMRWRALQAGRVYVRQHPEDARLSVSELRDMVGTSFSNRVLHYAASLRGTRPYWMRQRSRLIAMVDTLGLPTVFFTHSAADLQWPELANLICPDDADDRAARSRAVIDNPAVADWFFYERISQYLRCFYLDVLGAKDYWLRFEWQHRGSPHVHGLAWLPDAPEVEQLFTDPGTAEENRQQAIAFIDSVISTTNPALLDDGSNLAEAPLPQTHPHICNKAYADVNDHQQDLTQLIATCQRHTTCSTAYCLRTKNGKQECRFGYPKPLQAETSVAVENGEVELQTARNDPLINSFNRIQLSGWRANVDMQYCVSRQKVIQYCAKYATKCEPRSQTLKDVYATVVRGLKEDDKSLKAVQKLLIHATAERDYSAQETCHLLLQIPMFMASRDFVVLSLDGSRQVEEQLEEGKPATAVSTLDHYINRPGTQQFERMTLLHFVQHYSMPKGEDEEPSARQKEVVVIARPYCSPDPNGPQYEQYCRQKMMLHRPFRHCQELQAGFNTFTEAYADFLQSGNVPPSLEDDVHRLQQQQDDTSEPGSDDELSDDNQQGHNSQSVEEWMLLCTNQQHSAEEQGRSQESIDWCASSQQYPNIGEMPTFITRSKENAQLHVSTSTAAPELLQGKQRLVYDTVSSHMQSEGAEPLRMVVSGTAGTGKSFLIHCLKALLQSRLRVAAPTGVAAFNVEGVTLHSLLQLPTRGDFKDLGGDQLRRLQQQLDGVDYLVIDEMSMVGRKLFGQVDQRLRQAFPRRAAEVLGGCSCLLVGDFGQLPPVMDLPLYSSVSRSAIADLGRTAYQFFTSAVTLTQVMRQNGQDSDQVRFRELLLHLRDGTVSIEDWKLLMTRCLSRVDNPDDFSDALHLYPTREAAAAHNISKLRSNGQPIATINAVHSGPNASKASSDDAAGLEPVISIARGARVMLTSNLWVDAGLVNGAMGTICEICYESGGPPNLPVAVMVKFDKYWGPTLHDGTVPIVPLRRTWIQGGSACSRLQLPLRLAWAITIHKAQGLTLDKVVIDVGKKEFSAGLTFVACSRVRRLSDLVFNPPFDYQRAASLAKSQRLIERRLEDSRLCSLE